MSLTVKELQERAHYLGSSDIPALLGVSPYQNQHDLWLAKTGRLELEPTTNPAADLGDRLEPALVQLVADELVTRVEFNRRVMHRNGFMSAQLDGWLPDLNRSIEAKTRGLFNPTWDGSDWGDGRDDIPFDVLAQTQFALLVTNCDAVEVVALLGRGMGVRRYTVTRRDSLIELIEERATRFWEDNVRADVPPEYTPHVDTLKRVVREPGKSVEVDHELPFEWEAAKEEEAAAKARVEEVKAKVLTVLGDAEQGVTPYGGWTYTPNKNGTRVLRYKGPKGS